MNLLKDLKEQMNEWLNEDYKNIVIHDVKIEFNQETE